MSRGMRGTVRAAWHHGAGVLAGRVFTGRIVDDERAAVLPLERPADLGGRSRACSPSSGLFTADQWPTRQVESRGVQEGAMDAVQQRVRGIFKSDFFGEIYGLRWCHCYVKAN